MSDKTHAMISDADVSRVILATGDTDVLVAYSLLLTAAEVVLLSFDGRDAGKIRAQAAGQAKRAAKTMWAHIVGGDMGRPN